MAEAFAKALGRSDVEVVSAGSRPSGVVNPRAVQMMGELGLSMAQQKSKSLDEIDEGPFDAVVTMGCGDSCPWIPAKRRLDWALPDPKNLSDDEFRNVRDEIGRRVASLLEDLTS
jgi:arsenate reductase